MLHRRGDRIVSVEQGRAVTALIPGARFVELDGIDHVPFVGDADQLLDEVETFVTGSRPAAARRRYLTTVMFTDIVRSTESLSAVGDDRWREILDAHHRAVRLALSRHRGVEVATTGDGFVATFDGPSRAVACGLAVVDSIIPLGIEVRVGVHSGEVETMGDDIGGLAVHLAARVAAAAGAGEVLATSTVVDLVGGSGSPSPTAASASSRASTDRGASSPRPPGARVASSRAASSSGRAGDF